MKSDRQQLLDDLLDEAAPPDFKETLWQQTLEAVRHRNHARRRNRAVLAVAVAIVIPVLVWRLVIPSAPTEVQVPQHGLVHSQSLRPAMFVETKPGTVRVITSLADSVAVIKTDPAKRLFQEIDDDQLLTLLAGRPAVLIREEPGQASLHFVNPEDQQGFPMP